MSRCCFESAPHNLEWDMVPVRPIDVPFGVKLK